VGNGRASRLEILIPRLITCIYLAGRIEIYMAVQILWIDGATQVLNRVSYLWSSDVNLISSLVVESLLQHYTVGYRSKSRDALDSAR
jgi:hypothetical protein